MTELRHDNMVRAVVGLWIAAPLLVLLVPVIPFAVLAWSVWALFTLTHVLFAWDAVRIARSTVFVATTRRVWAGLSATGVLLFFGDLVRMTDMLRTTPTESLDVVEGQAVLVGLAIGVAVIALLLHPLGLDSAESKARFALDFGVVVAATAAFSAYTIQWPETPSTTEIVSAVVLGPGASALAVLTVFKLVLAPRRPFTRPAGVGLLVTALTSAVLGGMGDSVLFNAFLPLGYLLSLLSSTLLPLSARLQRRSGATVAPGARGPTRRYALSPYFAVVGANTVMVLALADQGVDARSWVVVLATVTATGFVIVRQLATLTELRRLSGRLEHLALRDTLTGLANRRSFDHRLGEVVGEADGGDAGGRRAALLLIDLDGFKQVNDTFGHQAGDALLAEVGIRLQACVRSTDLVARLGGDEFAVIAGEGAECTEAIAARIVSAIGRPFALDGDEARIGASVGVARVAADGETPDDVLRRADDALYEAKRSGKGRVRLDPLAVT
ncbi:MAG: GGDEF domain-containing protein [Actinomycetota bacterium]